MIPLILPSRRTAKLLFCCLAASSSLFAQAWLFPKGTGTVSTTYQCIYVRNHVSSEGVPVDLGPAYSHGLLMDVDYSFTDKLALAIGLPYLAGKYSGPNPHQLPIDDGTYHATFQDFRIGLRYNVSKRPLAVTPFFETVIPSHSYEYFAHSAIGRGLREYHIGTNLGRRLDPVLPKAYFQARYSYAFVQAVHGLSATPADLLRFTILNLPLNEPADSLSPNRSDTDFQLGYFVTPRFSVLGLGSWIYTHDGPDFTPGQNRIRLTTGQFQHHDQIGRASLLDVGGGAAFSLRPSLQVFASVLHSLRGTNGHLHAAAVTVGMTWSFRTRFAGDAGPSAAR